MRTDPDRSGNDNTQRDRNHMSELRYDPIQGRWVIIATNRSRRPHDLISFAEPEKTATFCPFCPDNEHRTPAEVVATGRAPAADPNSSGWRIRVVPNRYPALTVEGDLDAQGVGLFDRMRGVGAHEVVIESPLHDLDLATMPEEHLAELLTIWQDRVRDLFRDRRLRYVLVFKNHGVAAGATLAHPHSQVIATPIVPGAVAREFTLAREHYAIKQRCLFCDVVREELERQDRVVRVDDQFVTIAPYASRFPFELMILPRQHQHDVLSADRSLLQGLARSLQDVCGRLKHVLEDPPFNLVLHTAPNPHAFRTFSEEWPTLADDFHWHLEIHPRLTRVAGFETGADFYINPTAPEAAASFLREVAS
ncbi:MAG: galactose-1-phosphate uridylyltransferase [bacterium]